MASIPAGSVSRSKSETEGMFYFKPKGWIVGMAIVLALATFWIVYQRLFGYTMGGDSFSPEFDAYWRRLLYVNFVIEIVVAIAMFSWMWTTRDRNIAAITPKEELRRIFTFVMWLSVYTFAVYWAASFFAEQDGAWHQVTIRDTSFTPSHIIIFYASFPMYIIIGLSSYLYAITRIPMFNKGVSFPLAMAIGGPLMIMPNVGYNEWGHAFWFMEEVFTAPLHWGFSILGWAGLFVGGLLMQLMVRISNLTDVIWGSADSAKLKQYDNV